MLHADLHLLCHISSKQSKLVLQLRNGVRTGALLSLPLGFSFSSAAVKFLLEG